MPPCGRRGASAMDELDRRSFVIRAAAGGLTLAAGADLAGPAAAALRAACRPGPPIPRTIERAIRGHVFTRSTPGFSGAAQVYNTVFDGVMPKWVARPINTADVRAAVRWRSATTSRCAPGRAATATPAIRR